GKVKNISRGREDPAESQTRLRGELGVVRRSDRILAPTSTEAGHLVRLYGADPDRISVVPPGVDRHLFAPMQRDEARARLGLGPGPMILFVGRLQPFKGPQIAIRAMALAVSRSAAITQDAALVIVGGPSGVGAEEVGRLRALAASLGIERRVRFVPPQPHPRLAAFYSASDVVIVPSRSESFGLVALEAQSCGRPVIGAAVGGLRHSVVDGVTGFLVEGHDPASYAERILRLLADPELRRRMGEAGMAHSSMFTWDRAAAEIGRVYRELTELRRGAA
ncbi:MAG TPA: glycosyltransferase, partial [Actinomycetota bacterium]